ncbi:MAG: hypothetical protein HC831_30130, partial [Chloroflexia bacterium]|nr:hypothetical protein [Chloroflexia bacterium]
KEYDFGDGGILENLGIMPLLKRQVKKIMVFVNCQTPLTGGDEKEEQITDSIPALFRPLNKKQYGSPNFADNVVFANQLDKYEILVNDLLNKINHGHAPVHVNTYHVTKQPHYNITQEYDVEVMWIYNAPVLDWEEKLNIEVKHLLHNSRMFERFPYYRTFMENPPEIVELKPQQTNLISHLSAWIVASNAELINRFLEGKNVPV